MTSQSIVDYINMYILLFDYEIILNCSRFSQEIILNKFVLKKGLPIKQMYIITIFYFTSKKKLMLYANVRDITFSSSLYPFIGSLIFWLTDILLLLYKYRNVLPNIILTQ